MATVLLGNAAPLVAKPFIDDEGNVTSWYEPDDVGNSVSIFEPRDDLFDAEVSRLALSTDNDPELNIIRDYLSEEDYGYGVAILEIRDAWRAGHSNDPPEWVECDDKHFAELLAGLWTWRASPDRHGHKCSVGRPDDWDASMSDRVLQGLAALNEHHEPQLADDNLLVRFRQPPMGGGAYIHDHFADEFSPEFWERLKTAKLLTNGGRDSLHLQHLGGSGAGAQPAQIAWMALANSSSATSPNATDTTLTGEINIASGGLNRGGTTYAHTGGTNVTTQSRTFTANSNDTASLPITASQDALFNASSSGTMFYKTALNATVTFTISGDNAAVTHTLTIG